MKVFYYGSDEMGSARTLYYIVLMLFLGFVGRYGYLKYMIYSMNTDLVSFNSKKIELQTELTRLETQKSIKKLQAARAIGKSLDGTTWSQQIRAIRAMLVILQRFSTSQIELSDFNITLQEMKLKGKVSDLKLLYQSGGVIDTFVNPNLVKNLMIRDYKKIGEFFEFSLDAEINLEDAVKQRNICG